MTGSPRRWLSTSGGEAGIETLRVGETATFCHVRHSARAKRLRLVVSPGRVEVVVPPGVGEGRVREFVRSRRDWLLEKTEALRERTLTPMPERYVSGAKILFRGRFLTLDVEPARVSGATLRFANRFVVRVPSAWTPSQREKRTEELVVAWIVRRAREDAELFVSRHAPRLGAAPAGLRIGNQRTVWGSCSARGVVSLNRKLMAVPRPVFEYVVVHELCHLREHNHGPRFWRLVAELLPDYRERRAWLKRHGVALG